MQVSPDGALSCAWQDRQEEVLLDPKGAWSDFSPTEHTVLISTRVELDPAAPDDLQSCRPLMCSLEQQASQLQCPGQEAVEHKARYFFASILIIEAILAENLCCMLPCGRSLAAWRS